MGAVRRDKETKYTPINGVPYEEMTEVERDFELEDRLIFLVAQLEQLMIRLMEQDPPQPAAALELLVEMVNRTAALTEILPSVKDDDVTLLRSLEDASRIHPLVHLLPVENNRLLIETIVGAGHSRMGYLSASPTSLHQVCQGLVLVLRDHFALFETLFYSPTMQDRWKGLYHVFVSDLLYAVTDVQPSHSVKRGNEARG